MSPKLPPPPPRGATLPPAQKQASATPTKEFAISSGRIAGPQRVVVYGTGGIGKSSLAALAPNPIFLDLESGTEELDVKRVSIDNWRDLRACLQSDSALEGFGTVVVDGSTKAQELAEFFVLETVPHEKGHRVSRLEDYGFSKGLNHVYESFLLLLQDLDRQIRKGRNVILLAHECISEVPNPYGEEDSIRFEPHLQSPKKGKSSIRNRVVQWAQHVLFIRYDVLVTKGGKGQGSGTRTIYTTEMPTHIAKNHGAFDPSTEVPSAMQYEKGDGSIWQLLLGGEK